MDDMVGLIHNYIKNTWYEYHCKNKKDVERIIREELEKRPNYMEMDIKKLCLTIKRACMSQL